MKTYAGLLWTMLLVPPAGGDDLADLEPVRGAVVTGLRLVAANAGVEAVAPGPDWKWYSPKDREEPVRFICAGGRYDDRFVISITTDSQQLDQNLADTMMSIREAILPDGHASKRLSSGCRPIPLWGGRGFRCFVRMESRLGTPRHMTSYFAQRGTRLYSAEALTADEDELAEFKSFVASIRLPR
jgi:hypothetical protein